MEKFGVFESSDGSVKTIFKNKDNCFIDILFLNGDEDLLIIPFVEDECLVNLLMKSIYRENSQILNIYVRDDFLDSWKQDLVKKIESLSNFGYDKINFHKNKLDFSNDIENDDVKNMLKLKDNTKEFDEWVNNYKVNEKQRTDVISWDEFFMAISKLSALRSKDPSTQVGASIVGRDNRISEDNRLLSIGYNGAPNGFRDYKFPWDREGDNLNTKYFYVVHAERNAILNYRGSRKDFEGARVYVDLFPCNECAKEIIQVGIKEVVYLSDKYKDTESVIASKKLFDECGVKYRQLTGVTKSINLDFKYEE